MLDDIGRQILRALQEDARISFSELGRRVGLSSPAVAERVRRMEEKGIILGYKAIVNLEKIGLPITALVRVNTHDNAASKTLEKMAKEMPEVLECHNLTGEDGLIFKVVVSNVRHLEEIIMAIGEYGQTNTSIVLSSPVTNRVVDGVFPQDSSSD